jgi:hypothetical protein
MHPGLWKHPVGVQVIEGLHLHLHVFIKFNSLAKSSSMKFDIGEDELLVLPESSNAPILCFSFMVTHTHGLSSTNFG